MTRNDGWQHNHQRFGAQLGSLQAILHTKDHLLIQSSESRQREILVQIARNFHQYYGADSELVGSKEAYRKHSHKGNVITVSQHPQTIIPSHSRSAIRINAGKGILVCDYAGKERLYPFQPGLGAIFLQPLSGQRLEMVIWGFDTAGLEYASRLVPMLTGVGQPDFIIVSKACLWKGAAGVLAAGFLDHSWQVSQASYLS